MSYLAALALGTTLVATAMPVASQTAPAPLSSAAPSASKWVVIPFEEPGSKDGHLADATNALTKELQSHGVLFVLAPVQTHVEVASNAAALCATYKGTQIVMGSYHVDQTNRQNALALFVPVLVVAAGAMKYAPTHAIVKLDQLDCAGTFTKHIVGDGNSTHHGNNADSTVVDTIVLAMHQATDRLTGVVVADPSASPTPAP